MHYASILTFAYTFYYLYIYIFFLSRQKKQPTFMGWPCGLFNFATIYSWWSGGCLRTPSTYLPFFTILPRCKTVKIELYVVVPAFCTKTYPSFDSVFFDCSIIYVAIASCKYIFQFDKQQETKTGFASFSIILSKLITAYFLLKNISIRR